MHKSQAIVGMLISRSAGRLLEERLLRNDRMDLTSTWWNFGAYWNNVGKFKSIDVQASTILFTILSSIVADNTPKGQRPHMDAITAMRAGIAA
jgi:hypothetical protein